MIEPSSISGKNPDGNEGIINQEAAINKITNAIDIAGL